MWPARRDMGLCCLGGLLTGTTCRPHAPGQALLLPPDLRAWLPESHLAQHVSDLVDALDPGAFHAPCRGDGPPSMGLGIASGDFIHDTPNATAFVAWVRNLFRSVREVIGGLANP